MTAPEERPRISERTKAGLKRAKREGKQLGRPRVEIDVRTVRQLQADGLGLRGIAAETGWSLSSIMRALKAAANDLMCKPVYQEYANSCILKPSQLDDFFNTVKSDYWFNVTCLPDS